MAKVKVSAIKSQSEQRNIEQKALDEIARQRVEQSGAQDSFVNYQHQIGVGAQNPLSSATYGFNPITRNRTLLEWMYRGSWIAGKLIDTIADDMTRAGCDIISDMLPEDIDRIQREITKLKIWQKINDTVKWSRLYGGAVAVIVIDGQDFKEPLNVETVGHGQFKGLISLDRWMIEPSLSDLVDDFGPEMGLPRFYKVSAMASALMGKKIHHTRIIRFTGVELPYWQKLAENMWGLSVLERVYDRLIAFDSATNGASQLVYKSYIRYYKLKGLRELLAAGGQAKEAVLAQINMMREYQGIEGMTLLDGEDDVTSDSHAAFSGLSDILIRFMEQISGSEQIPLVKLFGQSPSGFSTGETDVRNYYDTIDQRRQDELLVDVTKIYKITLLSLGIEIPDDFAITFRSLWQLDDVQKSEIAQRNTDTIRSASESGMIKPATALKELKQQAKTTGIFSNITDDEIAASNYDAPPELDLSGIEPIENTDKSLDLENPFRDAKKHIVTAAGCLLVDAKNRVLLVKRGNQGDHAGEWAFPGGKIEHYDAGAYTAACRETLEETGIDAKNFIRSKYAYSSSEFVGFVFKLPMSNGPTPVIDSESTDAGWFGINELPHPMHPGALQIIDEAMAETIEVKAI